MNWPWLLSSHDLDEVQRVAERVAVIRAGRIVADDTVETLRSRAPRTMEVTFDHGVDADPLRKIPGVSVTVAAPRHLTLTLTGALAPVLAGIARLEPETLLARPANLDELFRRLYDDPGITVTTGGDDAR